MNKGIIQAIGAYVIWGVSPIFFKWLQHVPAVQLLAHRIVWSCLVLGIALALAGQWHKLHPRGLTPAVLRTYTLAALLIAINWLAFVWAATTDRVVEASLGYFITPLVNVLFGVMFMRERLRALQWGALALAAAGVLYLTFSYGAVPWIAIVLALSFGSYGLVKKTAPLGSIEGVTLETLLLLAPATIYLMYTESNGTGAFSHTGVSTDLLLVIYSIIVMIPLLLFAAATKRVSLSLVGVLFYIAPTLQFLQGILIFGEPFTHARLVGFAFVWTALLLFSADGVVVRRSQLRAATDGA